MEVESKDSKNSLNNVNNLLDNDDAQTTTET